jgi:hypothetical protein
MTMNAETAQQLTDIINSWVRASEAEKAENA